MVEHGQVNIRIPGEAKGVVIRLARRLREEPTFLARLNRWLAEEADDSRSPFLAERLARLEERVADLARQISSGSGADRPAAEPARGRQADMFGEPEARQASPRSAPAEASTSGEWTTGEGRGRRLTTAGRAEMQRLIEAGRSDREIADALGVRPFTVANQRKVLRSEAG